MMTRSGPNAHREALEQAKACAFLLRSAQMTGKKMAEAFVNTAGRMAKWYHLYTRPLIVLVGRDGSFNRLTGERRGGVKR